MRDESGLQRVFPHHSLTDSRWSNRATRAGMSAATVSHPFSMRSWNRREVNSSSTSTTASATTCAGFWRSGFLTRVVTKGEVPHRCPLPLPQHRASSHPLTPRGCSGDPPMTKTSAANSAAEVFVLCGVSALPVEYCLHHFVQWLVARIDEVLRHAGLVEHAGVLRVDAGTLVERGEDFLKRDGTQLRMLTIFVG